MAIPYRLGKTIGSAAVLGLTIGTILFLGDYYLGRLFLEISPRAYVANFAAYACGSVGLAVAANLLLFLIRRAVPDRVACRQAAFIAILAAVGYVYANAELTGVLYSWSLRSVVVNAILGVGMIALVAVSSLNHDIKRLFSTNAGLITISFLTFHLTAQFNYFFMHFPETPESRVLIILTAAAVVFIPLLAALLTGALDRQLERAGASARFRPVVGLLIVLVAVLVLPPVLQHPFLGPYLEDAPAARTRKTVATTDTPNLIWIVLDTARKDRFSCYGNSRNTTPNIDALAADGVLFENFVSTAPWTAPAHASMFTGMYASKHGCHNAANGRSLQPLGLENVTIAETLRDAGMRTGAIVSNYSMSKSRQLDQGFGFYYCQPSRIQDLFWGLVAKSSHKFYSIYKSGQLRLNYYQLGSEINRTVFHWLDENAGSPMFLFVNYMEAHTGANYIPEPYGSRYGFTWQRWNQVWEEGVDVEAIINREKSITPAQLQVQYDRLDGKLSYLDAQVGRLFDKLKAMDIYDDSMIVVVSDHGDLYGEHNSFNHTTDLYHELISVPLIVKYPESMKRTGRVSDFIQTVDIMPEALAVLGVPVPAGVQGQEFARTDHAVISELYGCDYHMMNKLNPERYARSLRSIIEPEESVKYIRSTRENDSELFDIAADPGELENLITDRPAAASRLAEALTAWYGAITPVAPDTSVVQEMDAELKRKLKSLGYIR